MLASDRMKPCHDCLLNSARFQQEEQVWFYHLLQTTGKSPKIQKSWGDLYQVIIRINDVVCRIQRYPNVKIVAVH
jgi:hypothetical protein